MSLAVLMSQMQENMLTSSGMFTNDENLVLDWKPEPSGLSSSEVVFWANRDATRRTVQPASASVCGCR